MTGYSIETTTKYINELLETKNTSDEGLIFLLENEECEDALKEAAVMVRKKIYGNDVYVRGLIEFSNYCKNDCYYCGIRCGNKDATRYRLSKEEILSCCDEGYELGFRTFVLQSGEDLYFTDEIMCDLIRSIKKAHPDCALTISIGEKTRETYQAYFDAGADRYLLRHETANKEHYEYIHPKSMSFENRQRCLFDLKEIGYQVGAGIMVGSPKQTTSCLIDDIRFLQKLQPDMIGIGPFLPHNSSIFKDEPKGDLHLTLRLLSLLRLLFPEANLPSTTALGTLNPKGRELGILAGANVVMPNLSPTSVRAKYELYENKICTGDESAQCRDCLNNRMKSIGYEIVTSRGDRAGWN